MNYGFNAGPARLELETANFPGSHLDANCRARGEEPALAESDCWLTALTRIPTPLMIALCPSPKTNHASRRLSGLACAVRGAAYFFVSLTTWAVASGEKNAQTSPASKWELSVGRSDSSPALGKDGTVYLGTFGQRFWAVSSNGVSKWTFKTGSEVKSSPAVGRDGTIYFGCRDRKFYAVSPQGKKKWEFATGAWVDSSPALARDGTIYFGSWDKHFYALNPDGSVKWRFQTGGEIDSSPAVGADGTIYFGSHDKKFYALTFEGRKRWEFATGGQIVSSPALNGGGVVYFTSVDGFFYALNEDGSLRWRLHTGGITESSPVIGLEGTLYVGVNNYVWAIAPDGKKKWERQMIGVVEGPPLVVADGSAYVVSWEGDLVALDTDGHSRWSFFLWNNYGCGSPAIGADGTVYAQGKYYSFLALDANQPLARTPWPKFRGDSRNTGNVNETTR